MRCDVLGNGPVTAILPVGSKPLFKRPGNRAAFDDEHAFRVDSETLAGKIGGTDHNDIVIHQHAFLMHLVTGFGTIDTDGNAVVHEFLAKGKIRRPVQAKT
jgi:hypothetical protein